MVGNGRRDRGRLYLSGTMRSLAGVLAVAVLAAVCVHFSVKAVDSYFHNPPAFCPDDVGEDAPHANSQLDPHAPEGPVLYEVDGDEMFDMTSQFDGHLPSDFPYRPALICQYPEMSDEQVYVCPTGGGGEIPVHRTRYYYKVYDLPGRELLGEFDLLGVSRCEWGIVTTSVIPMEPDYTAIAEHTAPLLR